MTRKGTFSAVWLLLAAPVLAGCVSQSSEPIDLQAIDLLSPDLSNLPLVRPGSEIEPRLDCYVDEGGVEVCNFRATVTNTEGNEVTIAVNPRDPLNILAGAKDYNPDATGGQCVWDGYYVTKDGGRTWKNGNMPGSNWKRLKDPTEPVTPLSKYWCATDPVVAFGPDGRAYYSVMGYQCDPGSASKTGRGVFPQGGINDFAWTCAGMYVAISRDGGETWLGDDIKEVGRIGPRLMHDKQWLTVAPDAKTLYLTWDWNAGEGPASQGHTAMAVSRDAGETWEPYFFLDTESAPGAGDNMPLYYPQVDVGADGSVSVIGTTFTNDGLGFGISRSTDAGRTWSRPREMFKIDAVPGALRGSAFRVFPMPNMAVDRTAGPFAGSIYVAWNGNGTATDGEFRESDVFVSVSRDGGGTWSAPARVNDDTPGNEKDQFMPAISVSPRGEVDVSWYDRRDDPGNHLFHTYFATSGDGGATFTKNIRVTDVASDEQYSHHQNGMIFLGDYRHGASSTLGATFLWTDTRNQRADVYVATVLR